jgi:hypothetical protein
VDNVDAFGVDGRRDSYSVVVDHEKNIRCSKVFNNDRTISRDIDDRRQDRAIKNSINKTSTESCGEKWAWDESRAQSFMNENLVDEVETDPTLCFGKCQAEGSECSEFSPAFAIETVWFGE